ncbi:hypothetical protein V6N12_042343 [Hibiscus sabdariffa]|uniref:Uncharacterized protein n=1 Tax=Hibiscus sabdariffa TaxID=183260 RepID=A0ABR2EEI4_9ROSI
MGDLNALLELFIELTYVVKPRHLLTRVRADNLHTLAEDICLKKVVADKSKKTRSRSRSRDVVATLDKRVDELLASVKDVQGVCRRDTCP